MPTIIESLRKREGRAMTIPEVAQLLNADISTVYRKVRNGRLPGFGIDGMIRVDPSELADHLEAKTRLGVKKNRSSIQ